MAVIEVEHLRRQYGAVSAVDDISFSVEEGEILVIVGSSGCGKTTTLRSIAGLDTPTSGCIRIDGRTVVGDGTFVPPEHRGVGMVFQSYALWPHKTIFENVAYSLVVKGIPIGEIRQAVADALALVGLSGSEERYPSTLSGGQQQRIALARCAVARPRVMLLDEPLSNLDSKLREQMRAELRMLIKELRSTAVHITHDQTEAMGLADRIIVMRNGRIEQMGTGREIYRRPANKFVADFIGVATFLQGSVVEVADHDQVKVVLQSGLELWATSNHSAQQGEVVLCLRPESVEIAEERTPGANLVTGTILSETFLGNHTEYVINIGGVSIKSHSQRDFGVGQTVSVSIPKNALVCLPA